MQIADLFIHHAIPIQKQCPCLHNSAKTSRNESRQSIIFHPNRSSSLSQFNREFAGRLAGSRILRRRNRLNLRKPHTRLPLPLQPHRLRRKPEPRRLARARRVIDPTHITQRSRKLPAREPAPRTVQSPSPSSSPDRGSTSARHADPPPPAASRAPAPASKSSAESSSPRPIHPARPKDQMRRAALASAFSPASLLAPYTLTGPVASVSRYTALAAEPSKT